MVFGQLIPNFGGRTLPLLMTRIVLGRDLKCDLPLPLPLLSRHHCELTLRDGFWQAQDLQSANGTRVNDVLVDAEWVLPGDTLTLASYRFTLNYDGPANRRTPLQAEAVRKQLSTAKSKQSAVVVVPKAASDSPKLGVLIPCAGGDPIPIVKPTVVLGRDPSCDIVIRSTAVSSKHCRLVLANSVWTIHDLDSRHGIRVNGVRCYECPVRSGAVLTIADQRYELQSDAAPAMEADDGTNRSKPFAKGLMEAAGLEDWRDELEAEGRSLRRKLDDD